VPHRPQTPVLDDDLHAGVVPLGTRLRVAGTAEFCGPDLTIDPGRVSQLTGLLSAVYPRIAAQIDPSSGRAWTGLRPVSADGLPTIGPTPLAGLYVNAGHGHLGWTHATGSARLLADLLRGREPEIDPIPYSSFRS
jgi:D-amino-acid dehydrogenase